jgi:hypothetical protein
MKPMKATARVTKPETDRWRYGYRMAPRVRNGGVEYSPVPLRKLDLLFPQEGDRPVLTDDHSVDYVYLRQVLTSRSARRAGRHVFGDHRINFQVPGIPALGPDLLVLDGVGEWDGSLGTFHVRTMGATALLGIEITSEDTRRFDLGIKVRLYFECGMQWYAIVDRWVRRGKEIRVLAYRRGPDRFVPVPPDEHGRVWLEPVGLWLGLENRRATLYEQEGTRIPAPEERAETEARARRAETRARRAEARARKKAEERAASLEERVRQLEAHLRRKQNGA